MPLRCSFRGFIFGLDSPYVLARYLAREAPGARCYAIGEPPLVPELWQVGLTLVDGPTVDYVVVAFDRPLDYRKLDVALQAVVVASLDELLV
jgi:ribonucleotide monophosphatase NagD (HAD superfamily)